MQGTDGAYNLAPMRARRPRYSVRELVDEYDQQVLSDPRRTSPRSRASVLSTLNRWADWYEDTGKSANGITEDDLTEFLDGGGIKLVKAKLRDGQRLNPNTRNHYWSHLRSWLRWCMRKKYIDTDLALLDCIEPMKKDRSFRPIFLTPEQLSRLIAECPDPRDKALLAVNTCLTCRVSELRAMRVGNINFQDSSMDVWQEKQDEWVTKFIPPICERALREWLTVYLGGSIRLDNTWLDRADWRLFPARRGSHKTGFLYYPNQPISRSPELWQRYTEPFMGRVRWQGGAHTLRRSGAYAMLLATGDIKTVQHQLGHRREDSTMIYLRQQPFQDRARKALLEDFLPRPDLLPRITLGKDADGNASYFLAGESGNQDGLRMRRVQAGAG